MNDYWHLNFKIMFGNYGKVCLFKCFTTKIKTCSLFIVIVYKCIICICLESVKYSELFVRMIEKEQKKIEY